MSDTEKIKRISDLLNEHQWDDISQDEFEQQFEKTTISDIKDALWEFNCFVTDVCDILNA